MSYDSQYAAFPVSETIDTFDPGATGATATSSLSTSATWYAEYGAIATATDPSGLTTSVVLDDLGRPIRMYGPGCPEPKAAIEYHLGSPISYVRTVTNEGACGEGGTDEVSGIGTGMGAVMQAFAWVDGSRARASGVRSRCFGRTLRRLAPAVSMMQTTATRKRDDLRGRRRPRLDRPARRRVLAEPEVRAVLQIVGVHQLSKEAEQMPFVEGDDVVQEVAACSPDEPLGDGPSASRGASPPPSTIGPDQSSEHVAADAAATTHAAAGVPAPPSDPTLPRKATTAVPARRAPNRPPATPAAPTRRPSP